MTYVLLYATAMLSTRMAYTARGKRVALNTLATSVEELDVLQEQFTYYMRSGKPGMAVVMLRAFLLNDQLPRSAENWIRGLLRQAEEELGVPRIFGKSRSYALEVAAVPDKFWVPEGTKVRCDSGLVCVSAGIPGVPGFMSWELRAAPMAEYCTISMTSQLVLAARSKQASVYVELGP